MYCLSDCGIGPSFYFLFPGFLFDLNVSHRVPAGGGVTTFASWTIVEGHVTKAIFFLLFREPSFLSSRRFEFQAKEIDLCDCCGRAEEATLSIGSLDQYGDLYGYVHNFCDLWESDILLTGFTSSSIREVD